VTAPLSSSFLLITLSLSSKRTLVGEARLEESGRILNRLRGRLLPHDAGRPHDDGDMSQKGSMIRTMMKVLLPIACRRGRRPAHEAQGETGEKWIGQAVVIAAGRSEDPHEEPEHHEKACAACFLKGSKKLTVDEATARHPVARMDVHSTCRENPCSE